MTELTDSDFRSAFQATAEACGGDILQCCIDCEEEPIITRECLYDYLATYGGEKGEAVQKWIYDHKGTMKQLERDLTAKRVPLTWS